MNGSKISILHRFNSKILLKIAGICKCFFYSFYWKHNIRTIASSSNAAGIMIHPESILDKDMADISK